MNINDLNINSDIINLFDYTLNDDARVSLKKMLVTPLPSKEAIIERQDILKGFLANLKAFHKYSYSKIDFREVNYFLETFDQDIYLPGSIKLQLRLYKSKHYEYQSKCVQLIMLYHRLHHYIKNLPTTAFPKAYKAEIMRIDEYLSGFRPDYYQGLIRENAFKTKHILEIFTLIASKKKKMEIKEFHTIFPLFEAFLSAAIGIQAQYYIFPEIGGTGIELDNFYHPALKSPVKNSLATKSNVILLTGPNMSGKSTLLKAMGICTYLANIGFAIPAAKGRIPFYNSIDIFINLNDDLQSGYSHFMTEIINLKKVILEARASKKCFAIFDELFRGTNIDDALEISKTTLKGMLNFPDSLFFVSSHLHQLITMDEVKLGKISCHYLDCDLQNDTPTFTYQLKEGSSDIKIGRILFEKEKMNEYLSI